MNQNLWTASQKLGMRNDSSSSLTLTMHQPCAYHSISSRKLEGMNNLAKVIKRYTYGFVDDEYYFLKLMAASRRLYYKPLSPRFLH
ncbi:MAG: hypothetical protein AB7S52_06960 [Sphaerochaetaceae bacterium]